MKIDFGAAAEAGEKQPVQQAATVHFPELITQTQGVPANLNPFDLTPVRNALAPYEPEIAAMQSAVNAAVITDADSAEYVVEIGARAKKAIKSIESARKRFVEDPKAFAKEVDGLAKYYKDKLDGVVASVSVKYSTFQREQEAIRRKAEEEARKEAARLQREAEEAAAKQRKEAEEAAAKGETPPPAPVVPEIVPEAMPKATTLTRSAAGAASVRKDWAFEIQDVSAIPREFMMPDERAIREAMKNGITTIPGVRIFQKETTVFRTN